MPYYILDESIDKKIVGKYPQAIDAEYNCSVWDDPRFVDHETVSFKKVEFNPVTAKAILVKKAKLTDYIFIGVNGFTRKPLVSGKLKSILEVTNNPGLQFYNSPVIYQGNEVEDYWVLNPFMFDMQAIDFKIAEVYLMEKTFDKIKKLPIFNFNDFQIEKKAIDKIGYPFSIRIFNINILGHHKRFFSIRKCKRRY